MNTIQINNATQQTKKILSAYSRKMIFSIAAILIFAAGAAAQSGGSYDLSRNVMAGGGASSSSSGGQFSLDGTIGQTVAGQTATGAPFSLHAGFWNAPPLAPTAANVAISGRVLTADGRGIRNAFVTLVAADGTTRTILSSKFGAFRFADVAAGQSIVVSVSAKRFVFAAPTLALFVQEDLTEVNFVAYDAASGVENGLSN